MYSVYTPVLCAVLPRSCKKITMYRGSLTLISVIIPTLNEAANIVATLQSLQAMRQRGNEVIVVDGGSSDATTSLAAPLADRIIHSNAGRARQMNAGAATARGDILWFLHADTIPDEKADCLIRNAVLKKSGRWGYFHVRLSGHHPPLRMIETCMNIRTRLTAVATGDQGIFVEADLFRAVGGFADIPLMEDIEISKKLKQLGRPARIASPLTTSSRRWEENGVFATILLMWRLRLAWFLGANPEKLARRYR